MSTSVNVNRLVDETSTHLRQHSTNPVDWRAWDKQTMEEVRQIRKPVFLSIGFAACRWCNAMEREAFSENRIAEVLNRHFIPIKVDREEYPQVDHLYMNVTRILTGRGGWPNNLWLTPDLRPFYAGTYFSPDNFLDLSVQLAHQWQRCRQELEARASRIIDVLEQINEKTNRQPRVSLNRELLDQALKAVHSSFDKVHGGFSGTPKSPPHNAIRFVLNKQRLQKQKRQKDLAPALTTLDSMSNGAIRDHIGGGFHRRALDEQWRQPQFEKMLYDNALLLNNYTLAWKLTGEERYQRVARQTGEWMIEETQQPEGVFSSSLSADCHDQEGAFYLWTAKEIEELLSPREARLFFDLYNITNEGNLPQKLERNTKQKEGLNIPYLSSSLEEYARRHRRKPRRLVENTRKLRQQLLTARNLRLAPQRDEKKLLDLNGLAVHALAEAGELLPEPRFTEAAKNAADYLLKNAVSKEGDLIHSFRSRNSFISGNLDDYAFFIRGLLALGRNDPLNRWREAAEDLTWRAVAEFADRKNGGFHFTSKNSTPVLRRHRDSFDQELPSGNAVMTECLLRLYRHTRRSPYLEIAEKTLHEFSGVMHAYPLAAMGMLDVLQLYLYDDRQFPEPD